ncbi:MAG: putative toxin-antitoxin system toxin component, PIN family [Thermotogae bacterium]|jgi:putative PIN family toxin of toxin-antitoxin system|nr:putative toxin-antitoxin system toxin component, PIN family [Thermotogota bacterium]
MKIVIDTNIVVSAALGSETCEKAIIKSFVEDDTVIEPKIISLELSKFIEKIQSKKYDAEKIKKIDDFFKFFLSMVKIEDPQNILKISPHVPDNFFLSLAYEKKALFLSGDKLALESGKIADIDVMSAGEWIKFKIPSSRT